MRKPIHAAFAGLLAAAIATAVLTPLALASRSSTASAAGALTLGHEEASAGLEGSDELRLAWPRPR